MEVIWKKTTGYRLQHLKATQFSAVDIQKTWPQYTKPLGYKLVSITIFLKINLDIYVGKIN